MFLVKHLANFRIGIIKITKDDRTNFLDSFNTGGFQAEGKSFSTKITFLDHTAHTGREFGVIFLDIRPWIHPVKTPGAIRTTHHTEPAADTTVEIHGDNAGRFHLEGRLSWAYPHTGWFVAVVTEEQKIIFLSELGLMIR